MPLGELFRPALTSGFEVGIDSTLGVMKRLPFLSIVPKDKKV
jgi:hypothetical protein